MRLRFFSILPASLFLTLFILHAADVEAGKRIDKGGKPRPQLTAEELAFAAAVGAGDYAMEVDLVMSYDPALNSYVDEEGKGLWRPAGSDADDAAALWMKAEMERIGLQNVAIEDFPVHGFTPNAPAYVQVISPTPSEQFLGAVSSGIPGTVQQAYADPDGGITREVVYVGMGSKHDYEGKDVAGKIVLVEFTYNEMYWLNFPHMQAELKGAVGLIVNWLDYQQKEDSIYTADSEARPTIPAINVSRKTFATLKELALAGPTVVKMFADCDVTIPDTSHNIVGYIPGTTNPDELIVHGAIYDKHWYGFHHHISDVSAMLQMAKALIDSGYQPSRTLAFVAIGAEEYGWTDTFNAWAIGSHFHAHYDHPDWGGRSRVFVEILGSLLGDYTVSLGGNPGTHPWRLSVISVINEFFTTHEPWSAYYQPAGTRLGRLPSTWLDTFNYGTSGMETMTISSSGSDLYDGCYHCQLDDGIVSAEALALNAIASGLNTIRMDRALIEPCNFAKWADYIKRTVHENAMAAAGISTGRLDAELSKLEKVGDRVWDRAKDLTEFDDADAVNVLLMQATKDIFGLIMVGGWGDESILGHEHYQNDTRALRATIEGLEEGNIDAIWNLFDVYGGYYVWNVDYEVYHHFYIEGTAPDYPGLMWGDQGREAHFTDVYQEFYALYDKMLAGDTDYSAEIALLQPKYDTAVANLVEKTDKLLTTLIRVNARLAEAEALLKKK